MKIFFISILIYLITYNCFSQDKYSILDKYLLNHPIKNECSDDFYIIRKVKSLHFNYIGIDVESNRKVKRQISILIKKYFCDYIDSSTIDNKQNIKVNWSKNKLKVNSKTELTFDDMDENICFVVIGKPIILQDNYLIWIEECGHACGTRRTLLSLYKTDTNNNLSKIKSRDIGGIASPCFR